MLVMSPRSSPPGQVSHVAGANAPRLWARNRRRQAMMLSLFGGQEAAIVPMAADLSRDSRPVQS
jgi:hypothetical protein